MMFMTQVILLVFVVCVMLFATARSLDDVAEQIVEAETAAKSEGQVEAESDGAE